MVSLKKGHSVYISLSCVKSTPIPPTPPTPPSAEAGAEAVVVVAVVVVVVVVGAWLSAAPTPSHAGRLRRVCVHAKVQGMALKDSMPPLGLRFDGLEPMLRLPMSGVARLKYEMKRGSTRRERYCSQLTADSVSIADRHVGLGSTCVSNPSARTAAVYISNVRSAIPVLPKF
jgi:hypothetical protein